ncbi:hybrid sensor histidine kinase/response regulator [Actomonas aquatica]|uniref:histidine kinase n=1 Tax=Actomonas aquatica TaxID=2866162 RepID=A0ABZ1CHX8_9BACT|nr:ATP-binding protein [Opitutus sp. WL0086]WRQ89865.1 ATP-binding protein [Opitutus sp. WL0086]
MLLIRPPFFWRLLQLAAVLLAGSALVSAQSAVADAPAPDRERGLPMLRTFGVRDYEGHNQNWAVVQDRAGLLYVGNKDAVLTYDGQAWNRLPVPGLFIRGLAVDAEDRIWVTGVGEFGYLESNAFGGRDYVSLTEHLPPEDRQTLELHHCVALPHGIYFSSIKGLQRWHDGRLTLIAPGRRTHFSVIDDVLWLHYRDQPLQTFDGASLRDITAAPSIVDDWVIKVLPLAPDARLIVTERHGLFLLHDDNADPQPWPNELAAALTQLRVNAALRLADGTLAIGTNEAGVFLLDPAGRLLHQLQTDNNALLSDTVLGLQEDDEGNLWIAANNGLAQVRWPAAYTRYGSGEGLPRAGIRTALRHQGRLYLTTNAGAYVLQPAAPTATGFQPAHFAHISPTRGTFWGIDAAGDELLLAGNGLHVVTPAPDPQVTATIEPQTFFTTLHVSRQNPTVLWVGAEEELRMYRRAADGWTHQVTLSTGSSEVRIIVEDATGALWLSLAGRGFARVTGPVHDPFATADKLTLTPFPGEHGLASALITGLPQVTAHAGQLRFLDANRIYSFDTATERFQPVRAPLDELGLTAGRLATVQYGDDGRLWIRTTEDGPNAGPWDGRVFRRLSADGHWQSLPFAIARTVAENPLIYTEQTAGRDIVWLGGSDGLVRAELPAAFVAPTPFATRLQRIEDNQNQLLPIAPTAAVNLAPAQKRLTFTFGTDRLDDAGMRFQTRLDYDPDGWSPWSPNRSLTLNYLPPGEHTLSIRAQDNNGRVAETLDYAFVVPPRWWQTPWAGLLAVVALAGVFYAGARLRSRSIEQRNAELAAQVAHRTEELRLNQAELEQARDEAEAANRAKSVFLASMSHELRTPLNAILGYSQLLRHRPDTAGEINRQLTTIQHSGEHLLQMINEVLDLAKIEAGRVELNLQPTSLPRLLSHLQEVFALRASQRRLAFSLRSETALPETVVIDEARLRQVLYNLLGNAVKFTAAGRVELLVALHDERLHFAVEDTGPGIALADQGRVFDFFQQAAGPQLAAQGAGLGLAISQRLVGLMQGRITLQSTPGRGSRFAFAIPVTSSDSTPPFPVEASLPTGYTGPRRRVLIVDDEPVNRDVLRTLLAPLGFELAEADDGETALQAIAAAPPDLVLMDLRLRSLDGLSATRRLRAQPATAAVRVIAISASVFPDDRAQALAAGCDEFVAKPIDTAVLCRVIGEQLDLEWTWLAAPSAATNSRPAVAADAAPPAGPRPPEATLRELYQLSDDGDLIGLRAALQTARQEHPAAAVFLDALSALAAETRLSELRRWLHDALESPPSASS